MLRRKAAATLNLLRHLETSQGEAPLLVLRTIGQWEWGGSSWMGGGKEGSVEEGSIA